MIQFYIIRQFRPRNQCSPYHKVIALGLAQFALLLHCAGLPGLPGLPGLQDCKLVMDNPREVDCFAEGKNHISDFCIGTKISVMSDMSIMKKPGRFTLIILGKENYWGSAGMMKSVESLNFMLGWKKLCGRLPRVRKNLEILGLG